MSSYINGSNNKNMFYFREYIDNEKLISKILANIESKIKVVEEYKNKYYNSNKFLENIIMTKFEFLEILNEFEETITQSLQGMRSLIAEIRNLKEKKEMEEKLIKKRNNSNNLCYNYQKDENFSQYLENNENKINIEEQIKEKNKSFCEQREISLYTNLYGPKNNKYLINNKLINGTKNKLYYKYANFSSKNMPSNTNKKKLKNNDCNHNNEISEFESIYSYEDKPKLINNRNMNMNLNKNKNKTFYKFNKNYSISDKNTLTYDLSIINDNAKDNYNNSYILNNNNNSNKYYNDFNNNNYINNNKQNNKTNNCRILRLQLKHKNNDMNNNNENNKKNNNNDDEQNKNNSMSKKYELELQNTNQEKSEKIEVEIKCPLRQGIRQNCRKNSARNTSSKNDIIKSFNVNKNKQEIIEKINYNEKLKNYFSKKYGRNDYDLFLNKFWKNKLNANDINNEVSIISAVIKKEEALEKKGEKNIKHIPYRNNNNEYEFKFLSKTPVQNYISKKRSNGNNSYKTITSNRNSDNKYFDLKQD
jgi:hypothetical protein